MTEAPDHDFTPDEEDIAAAKANADGWGFNPDYAEDAA
jgi:hypothetical protein